MSLSSVQPKIIVLASTILSIAMPSISHARCDLLPAYKDSMTFDGHKTADNETVRVFTPDDEVGYTVKAPFVAVGGLPEGDCVSFPEGQSAVLVNMDRFTKKTFTLEGAPFAINLYVPSPATKADVEMLVEKIERFQGLLSPLFPTGFGADGGHKEFDWLVTTGLLTGGKLYGNQFGKELEGIYRTKGDDAAYLLSPSEGNRLAVINLPFDHPRLDEQIIHDLVRLHTKVYPHKDMGPKERRQKLSLKIDFGAEKTFFPLADYDALMAGWAGFVYAGNVGERSRQLYSKFIDFMGYTAGEQEKAEALHPLLYGKHNPDFAEKWSGMKEAADIDAYFFQYIMAPLMAMQIEDALENTSATDTLKDLFIKVNSGESLHLEKALGEHLTPDDVKRLLSIPVIENKSADAAAQFIMPAARRKYIDIPYPRPDNQRISSMGGTLDTRLYMANPDEPSRTAFVLTHGGTPREMSIYARSYDLMAMPIIKNLWKYGDVLVLQRYSYGDTSAVPAEFLNSKCNSPRYVWGIRSSDQHFANAAAWLRASGYTKIIGVANGSGALPLLSAASVSEGYDQLYLFDPWRTVQGKVCKQDELKKILKGFLSKIKVPTHVINGGWTALYEADRGVVGGMHKLMEEIFGQGISWYSSKDMPAWALGIVGAEQYPDVWWPMFEKSYKADNK